MERTMVGVYVYDQIRNDEVLSCMLHGRAFLWDATYVDTLASSHIRDHQDWEYKDREPQLRWLKTVKGVSMVMTYLFRWTWSQKKNLVRHYTAVGCLIDRKAGSFLARSISPAVLLAEL
ncbi:jg6147 [Pararge aegeria aegeria]|uniref:Jg6147 protein n=1 Tax=Pararge aegeria aegeria TaxID=348720 RepID=A0A8S4RD38_9NEOP|nr:jg6147 [Pararge aegeria aegeria]